MKKHNKNIEDGIFAIYIMCFALMALIAMGVLGINTLVSYFVCPFTFYFMVGGQLLMGIIVLVFMKKFIKGKK